MRRALISTRQHGQLRLAARLRARPGRAAITGAMRSRCCETTSATPFFFNFHHGDLGNFSVIGPSGSGKTVVMNFLAAQAQKFAPAHDPVRQGPRRRAVRPRHRRALRPHRRPASRPASTRSRCPTRRPTAPSCATGSACCSRPTGRRSSRRSPARSMPPTPTMPSLRRLRHFRELLVGRAPARSRATSPTGSTPWIDGRRARLAVRQRRRPARPVARACSAST